MIVWGSGGDIVHLGGIGDQECEHCGQPRPFSVVLNYRYFGFYWVFNCVTERRYLAACDVCGHGWKLNPQQLESDLPAAPIPFMRRYGLLVLVGAVAVLVAASQIPH